MAIEYVDNRAKGLRPRRAAESVAVGTFVRRLDWVLLGAVAAIIGYGLWVIDGVTRHDPGGSAMTRQATFAAAGAIAFVVAVAIDPDLYRRYYRVIYGGTLAVMLIVLVSAAATRGSRRWIDLGAFRFQPSEFGKVLFTLFLAAFLADRIKRVGDPRVILQTVGLAVIPLLLVFVQPDIGTALVYGAALAAVLFAAGTRWLHLSILGRLTLFAILAVLWLPKAGIQVLRPYQAERLYGFTNPGKDPRGTTYNVNQSITAVGAGGVNGRGVIGATQTNLDYLPEHATDFVFASLAEQRGFVGVSILLLLYLLVVWRGLKVMTIARDAFSAIVAGGIVFAFLFQIFVNVGMTIGIAPITGIPLPFVSVGGSSMVSNLLAMGVLQAIHARSVPERRRSRR